MFRPDGFQLPFGNDDEPEKPDEPVAFVDDPPPRSWFWPAFCLGFVLVLLLT